MQIPVASFCHSTERHRSDISLASTYEQVFAFSCNINISVQVMVRGADQDEGRLLLRNNDADVHWGKEQHFLVKTVLDRSIRGLSLARESVFSYKYKT